MSEAVNDNHYQSNAEKLTARAQELISWLAPEEKRYAYEVMMGREAFIMPLMNDTLYDKALLPIAEKMARSEQATGTWYTGRTVTKGFTTAAHAAAVENDALRSLM